jgi:prepilin-type N-terminal cleavage/methylation domain-containing protein
MKSIHSTLGLFPRSFSKRAFTLIELLVVIAIIAILAGMLIPALARAKDKAQNTVDLSNVKQVLLGVGMYTTDNGDFMPHPTWGSVPGGAPLGWAYSAVLNDNGSVKSYMPAATLTASATDAQAKAALSNQLPYFRISQIGQYIAFNQQVLECPKDVATRGKGEFRKNYMERPVKLTAYTFSGAIAGYSTPSEAKDSSTRSGTYKITAFAPTGYLLWETDETVPFNFNDAGQDQENSAELVSQRHGTTPRSKPTTTANFGGGAMLGTFGLSASFTKWKHIHDLQKPGPPYLPNDLYCGPAYPHN